MNSKGARRTPEREELQAGSNRFRLFERISDNLTAIRLRNDKDGAKQSATASATTFYRTW